MYFIYILINKNLYIAKKNLKESVVIMLNYSYTPKWLDLINVFTKNNPKKFFKIIKNTWCLGGKDFIKLFTRSSWIIYFLALSKIKQKKDGKITIWLPSYYCNDVVYLIEKINVEVLYYDVNNDFVPNTDSLKKLSRSSVPDIILFCHFFGMNRYISYLKDLSLKYNAWLIEDCTHVISPSRTIGKHGDVSIYSPYKFFPLPHGSIMVSSKNFLLKNKLNFFLNCADFDNFIKESLTQLNYSKTNNIIFISKWLLKKILTRLKLSFTRFVEFSHQEKIKNIDYFSFPILDTYSLKILSSYAKNIYQEKEKRWRMFMLWKHYLLDHAKIKDNFFLFNKFKEDEIPYFLLIGNFKDEISKIYDYLKRKKIPILTWPNLPDKILKLKSDDKSIFLRNNLIFLPLHDQQHILIKKIKKRNNFNKIFSFKKIFDKLYWDELYQKTNRPSLLQSWDYGRAHSSSNKIYVKRFLIQDSESNLNIAILQVLHKKFLFLNFYRINRGPIFFKENKYDESRIVSAVFKKFSKNYQFKFLSITPELDFNFNNIFLNFDYKKIYFNQPSWSSFDVNLDLSLDLIEKNLDSKWRNGLNLSLKQQLNIVEDNSLKNLKSLIDLNEKDSSLKNFKSINKNFLYNFLSKSNYKIFNAYNNKDLVSSICVSLHNPGSTYLIGWSNSDGRKKNSMNLLIWKVIVKLKSDGFKHFDLGGYDKDVSKGIFDFKVGVGGRSYQLVGNSGYFNNFNL